MSNEDRKIVKFQVGFEYWVVFCLMHLVSDFKISLNVIMLVAVLLMLIFLILFQVKPFVYNDGSLNKNPFVFKITDRQ